MINDMDWISVTAESDISELMDQFGCFHDSCLKELHYKSGTYVNDDLSMSMINEPVITIIFQAQWKELRAIEMEFSDLIEFHLKPPGKEYTTEILGVKLIKIGGLFYWADWDNWNKDNEDRDEATWICAKSIRWRKREDLIGGELFYMGSAKEITINGNNFSDLEGFYDEIDRVLTRI